MVERRRVAAGIVSFFFRFFLVFRFCSLSLKKNDGDGEKKERKKRRRQRQERKKKHPSSSFSEPPCSFSPRRGRRRHARGGAERTEESIREALAERGKGFLFSHFSTRLCLLKPKKTQSRESVSKFFLSLLPLFLLLQREMDEARLRGLRVETHVQPGRTGKGKGRKEGEREKWNSRERRLREEAKAARGDAPRASLFFFFLRFFSFSSPSTSLT